MRSRGTPAGGSRFRVAAALLMAATLSGCGFFVPDHVHEQWRQPRLSELNAGALGQPGAGQAMVGLALSGGGSRAAVFAAAVIAELDAAGIASAVTHVSSVSGGGFAASYFVLKRPAGADGFDAFKQTMRADYFWDMELRQLSHPGRITSPTRRAISLQEALDDRFLDGATFADLPARPALLVNATRYDDGRRFLFSPLAVPEAPGEDRILAYDALRAASFSRPGCPRPTPADMPVSLAVATSAAFPPALGPVTLAAPADCEGSAVEYWHLGDGGVIENSGVETLEELLLRDVNRGGGMRRGVIFAVDASKAAFDPATLQEDDLRLWTTNPGIVVDAAKARGEAYHDLTWERVLEEKGVELAVVRIRYTDAALAETPESCGGDLSADAARLAARLADIPTDLAISACDADLMEAAAKQATAAALAENAALLKRWGFEPAASQM